MTATTGLGGSGWGCQLQEPSGPGSESAGPGPARDCGASSSCRRDWLRLRIPASAHAEGPREVPDPRKGEGGRRQARRGAGRAFEPELKLLRSPSS